MSVVSAAPAAVDGLLAVIAASPDLTAVRAVDGPPLSWAPLRLADGSGYPDASLWLFVGAQPGPRVAVSAQQDYGTVDGGSYDETLTIWCTAVSVAPDQMIRPRRLEALSVLAGLQKAITGSQIGRTLSGAVNLARVTGLDRVEQVLDDQGAQVVAVFSVEARAYLR